MHRIVGKLPHAMYFFTQIRGLDKTILLQKVRLSGKSPILYVALQEPGML